MFGKKKDDALCFGTANYKMKDTYNADDLFVANLQYVSNEETYCGPMVIQTEQKYIFEKINQKGKTRYREIFTGFIANDEESCYFNLPYVVNITPIKEVGLDLANNLPKYSLLLVLNEVNKEPEKKKRK